MAEKNNDQNGKSTKKKLVATLLFLTMLVLAVLAGVKIEEGANNAFEKPVIYLYGYDNDIDVSLSLSDDMQLTHTYPHYDGKWSIHASPDGTLTDLTGRKYDYLFWEGISSNLEWDMSSGFCIKGEDTARFLETILAKLGLNESESDDFITYWLPRMEDNPYNIISFQGNNYTDAVDIVPSEEPDAEIRVYMVWYGSDKPVDDLPVQKIKDNSDYVRAGKTIVEWGGTEIDTQRFVRVK